MIPLLGLVGMHVLPGIGHGNDQKLRLGSPLHRELDAAAMGVFERAAGRLGDRGRDPHLILALEAEQARDPARLLACAHDIALFGDASGQHQLAHVRPRTTTTPASSRPRASLRQSCAAIAVGLVSPRSIRAIGCQRVPTPSECRITVGSSANG